MEVWEGPAYVALFGDQSRQAREATEAKLAAARIAQQQAAAAEARRAQEQEAAARKLAFEEGARAYAEIIRRQEEARRAAELARIAADAARFAHAQAVKNFENYAALEQAKDAARAEAEKAQEILRSLYASMPTAPTLLPALPVQTVPPIPPEIDKIIREAADSINVLPPWEVPATARKSLLYARAGNSVSDAAAPNANTAISDVEMWHNHVLSELSTQGFMLYILSEKIKPGYMDLIQALTARGRDNSQSHKEYLNIVKGPVYLGDMLRPILQAAALNSFADFGMGGSGRVNPKGLDYQWWTPKKDKPWELLAIHPAVDIAVGIETPLKLAVVDQMPVLHFIGGAGPKYSGEVATLESCTVTDASPNYTADKVLGNTLVSLGSLKLDVINNNLKAYEQEKIFFTGREKTTAGLEAIKNVRSLVNDYKRRDNYYAHWIAEMKKARKELPARIAYLEKQLNSGSGVMNTLLKSDELSKLKQARDDALWLLKYSTEVLPAVEAEHKANYSKTQKKIEDEGSKLLKTIIDNPRLPMSPPVSIQCSYKTKDDPPRKFIVQVTYKHLYKIDAKLGKIEIGAAIGQAGTGGNSDGGHLHVQTKFREVLSDGEIVWKDFHAPFIFPNKK